MAVIHTEAKPEHKLEHELTPFFSQLATYKRRRQLQRSDVFQSLESEIERVLQGLEWRRSPKSAGANEGGAKGFRAAAWNIERGKQFESIVSTIRREPDLREADFVLLTEVDIGMARSGNRNVARELADELGMAYVFANQHIVLAPGDRSELHVCGENTLALHGMALLSRYPIERFQSVPLPERIDKFHAIEKRLGSKRALIAEVNTPQGKLAICVVHLDPFANGRFRGRQMQLILDALQDFGSDAVLLGGDLNTNTYDIGTRIGFTRDLLHKVTRFGFHGTISQYMTPGKVFERPVFNALQAGGFDVDTFNDVSKGTFHYDIHHPLLIGETKERVPKVAWRWLERRLEPYGGVVPMRIDWFAGKGVRGTNPAVIQTRCLRDVDPSDHEPITVNVQIET